MLSLWFLFASILISSSTLSNSWKVCIGLLRPPRVSPYVSIFSKGLQSWVNSLEQLSCLPAPKIYYYSKKNPVMYQLVLQRISLLSAFNLLVYTNYISRVFSKYKTSGKRKSFLFHENFWEQIWLEQSLKLSLKIDKGKVFLPM